jgi:hypothetical protein
MATGHDVRAKFSLDLGCSADNNDSLIVGRGAPAEGEKAHPQTLINVSNLPPSQIILVLSAN